MPWYIQTFGPPLNGSVVRQKDTGEKGLSAGRVRYMAKALSIEVREGESSQAFLAEYG